jgi:putative FmdB family regulatory protein
MTYEYICTACGHAWEAEQKISEAPLRDCPKCAAQTAKRQVSGGAGFILKGSGWYADLYSSSKGGKKDSSSDSESATSVSATASSTESKSSGTETKTASSDTKPAAAPAASSTPAAKPAASSS